MERQTGGVVSFSLTAGVANTVFGLTKTWLIYWQRHAQSSKVCIHWRICCMVEKEKSAAANWPLLPPWLMLPCWNFMTLDKLWCHKFRIFVRNIVYCKRR